MSKHPTLLQQFRSFCFQNKPKNFEEALHYFSIFGGMGWNVDCSKPVTEIIESKLLKNYSYIHGDLTKITNSDKTSHALLSGVAMGDGRVHSALKRARISRQDGETAIETLCEKGLLSIERSLEEPPHEQKVDDKLSFTLPFIRFWFSFISPYFKGIKEGNYKEVQEQFAKRENGFSNIIFEKLSQELLKMSFVEDPIIEIGSYWDRDVEIDILAKTASGKIIAGACKYSNAKANKNELTKLKEKCQIAQFTPDVYVLFSKSGFSNELKEEKGLDLKLFTLKHYNKFLEDLSEKDFLVNTGKKY